jgi:Skp family chaperone for outer membrane proteins
MEDRLQQQGALNVKKYCLVAALAAVVVSLGLLTGQGVGQAPVRPLGVPGIALVDVNYIFKNHPRFKSMMDDLKGDIDRAEQRWKTEAEKIKHDSERINDYRAGTQEYKIIEEEAARKMSDMQVRVKLEQKEFLQREAKVYFNVYTEIMQEVQYYCSVNNIGVVIRFNGDPINVEKPDDVLRGVNQQVVYYSKELDITPAILNRLGPKPKANTTPAPVGVVPRPYK